MDFLYNSDVVCVDKNLRCDFRVPVNYNRLEQFIIHNVVLLTADDQMK